MKHLADRASFIKLMIRDYADQLEIPPTFAKRRRGTEGKFVKSMGVCKEGEYQIRVWGSGGSHCWIVEAEKDGDGLFFRKGWPDFVKENNLCFADVLMFIHEERTKFLVKIFDPTGVKRKMESMIPNKEEVAVVASDEKDGGGDNEPLIIDPKEENVEDADQSMSKDLDEAIGEGDDGPMIMNTNEANGEDVDQPMSINPDDAIEEGDDKLMDVNISELPIYYFDNDGECHLEGGSGQEKRKKRKTEWTQDGFHHCEIKAEWEKEGHDFNEQTREGSFDLSPMKVKRDQGSIRPSETKILCHFDEEEKQSVKVSSALPPFSSSNTHFVANWSPTWQHYLNIPKEIAIEKDLHNKTQLLFCDVNGKIWFMKLSKQEDDTINTSEDWSKFCKYFGLKEGDNCTFEFTSSRIVHVHFSEGQ